MSGKVKRQPGTISSLRGRHVEIRVQAAGCWRGRLVGVTDGLLEIERHGGRTVLVPVGGWSRYSTRSDVAATGEREEVEA